ncbi:MAG: helix-turn-helix transcriptional regulator [Pirellulales bacterium]|nr:helix-turn-helix transcriptional regulator [Pirellulales bacterium]
MMKKRSVKFTDEIRAAIENCGITRYRIAKDTGIDAAVLCRFIHGQVGLSMDSLDKLAEYIGFHIALDKPKTTKGI